MRQDTFWNPNWYIRYVSYKRYENFQTGYSVSNCAWYERNILLQIHHRPFYSTLDSTLIYSIPSFHIFLTLNNCHISQNEQLWIDTKRKFVKSNANGKSWYRCLDPALRIHAFLYNPLKTCCWMWIVEWVVLHKKRDWHSHCSLFKCENEKLRMRIAHFRGGRCVLLLMFVSAAAGRLRHFVVSVWRWWCKQIVFLY